MRKILLIPLLLIACSKDQKTDSIDKMLFQTANELNKNQSISSIYNGIAITLDFVNDQPTTVRVMSLRSFGESLYHSVTDASLEFGYKAI